MSVGAAGRLAPFDEAPPGGGWHPERPSEERRPGPAGRSRRSDRVAAAFLAPSVVWLAVFSVLPAVMAIAASLFVIPIGGGSWEWVGFANYEAILRSADVRQAAGNTLLYCLLTVIPALVLGFALALLTNQLVRGRGLARAVLFLPFTANLVAMAVVFRWLFAFRGGLTNQMLGVVGIGPVNFLGDERYALPTVAAVGVWRATSFCMLIFLAGLTTIPSVVHEAARIDGIRGLRKIVAIDLPLLKPMVLFASVVTTIEAVQLFDTVRVMTDGGPLGSTETLLTLAWRIGFQEFELGKAAALSSLLLAVLVVVGLLVRRPARGPR